MTFHRDESGQVMLTVAFLFAVIIAIIAIMLNNLIFSNNVAYLGFMEQSKYDELSIKQMTTDEAAHAFAESNGNSISLQSYMADYTKSINSITVQKGRFIDIKTSSPCNGLPGGDMESVASTELSIYNKDSSKTYLVTTNYIKPPLTSPFPADRTPGNVIVKLGCNTSELSINPLGQALLVVEVINSSTLMPEPGVMVNLTAVSGHMSWKTSGDDVSIVNPFRVVTDYNGKAFVIYEPPGVVGQQIINAGVGINPSWTYKNLSNNASITVLGSLINYGPCSHRVNVWPDLPIDVEKTTSHGTDFVEVTIPIHINSPYDFIGNSPRFTVSLTFSSGTNLQQLSQSSQYLKVISDNNVVSSTTNYDNTVWIKLKRLNAPDSYSGTLTVTVTAHYNLDGGDYSRVVSIPISGP